MKTAKEIVEFMAEEYCQELRKMGAKADEGNKKWFINQYHWEIERAVELARNRRLDLSSTKNEVNSQERLKDDGDVNSSHIIPKHCTPDIHSQNKKTEEKWFDDKYKKISENFENMRRKIR